MANNYPEDFLHPQANEPIQHPTELVLPQQQEATQCSGAVAMVTTPEPAKKFKSDTHQKELLTGLNELREHNVLCDVTLVSLQSSRFCNNIFLSRKI